MRMMQSLIKVPEVAATMREMSRQMMKVIYCTLHVPIPYRKKYCDLSTYSYSCTCDSQAGIIEEMMDETLDTVTGIDEDDMEEEIQKEVDKVKHVIYIQLMVIQNIAST